MKVSSEGFILALGLLLLLLSASAVSELLELAWEWKNTEILPVDTASSGRVWQCVTVAEVAAAVRDSV